MIPSANEVVVSQNVILDLKKMYDGHLEVHLRIGPALCQHPQ
jgi:hypothetical protein